MTSSVYIISGSVPSTAVPNDIISLSPSTVQSSNQLVASSTQTVPSAESSFNLSIHGTNPITYKNAVNSKNNLGMDISKVAQNTHMLHSMQPEKQPSSNSALLTSLLTGPPSTVVNNSDKIPASHSDSMSKFGIGNVQKTSIASVGNNNANMSLNVFLPTQGSQVPQSSTVIISSNITNNAVSGATNRRTVLANSSHLTQNNSEFSPHNHLVNSNNVGSFTQHMHNLTTSAPISMNVIDSTNKINTYQNEYVSSVQKGQNLDDNSKSKTKSSKKRKKDKEQQETQISPGLSLPSNVTPSSSSSTFPERLKSLTTFGNAHQQHLLQPGSMHIPNGLSMPSLGNRTHQLNSSERMENPSSCDSYINDSSSQVTSQSQISPVSNSFTNNNNTPSSLSLAALVTTTTMTTMSSSTTTGQSSVGSGNFVLASQKQVVLQPGQNLKQLLLSPHNQEVS